MKYIHVVIMFCMFSMAPLKANENKLSSVLGSAGEKKIILKPPVKKNSIKVTHFIFKVASDVNVLSIRQNKNILNKEQSTRYQYENRSRFKFKFTPGTRASNIVRDKRDSAVNYSSHGVSRHMLGGRH